MFQLPPLKCLGTLVKNILGAIMLPHVRLGQMAIVHVADVALQLTLIVSRIELPFNRVT